MSEQAERFLKIEKAAQDTVTALEGLKKEAESYKTASKQLEAVGQKVSNAGDALLKAANETTETAHVLRAVGPDIKDDLKKIKSSLTELAESHKEDTKRIFMLLYIAIGISLISLVLLFLHNSK